MVTNWFVAGKPSICQCNYLPLDISWIVLVCWYWQDIRSYYHTWWRQDRTWRWALQQLFWSMNSTGPATIGKNQKYWYLTQYIYGTTYESTILSIFYAFLFNMEWRSLHRLIGNMRLNEKAFNPILLPKRVALFSSSHLLSNYHTPLFIQIT